jgi:hypothetical protein
MRLTTLVATALLTAGLAGCYTAEQSWLDDGNSVAPYQTITFQEADSDEVNVLTRDGMAYTMTTEEAPLTLRFMPLANRANWYVVEVSGEENGEVMRLYAILEADLAAGTASTYASIADDEDVSAGLSKCQDVMVCIDDLDAYIAKAVAIADSGAGPDTVYAITAQ